MGGLFLPVLARMRGIGMIERFAINILSMVWQMRPNRMRQIIVAAIWHAAVRACEFDTLQRA